MAHVDICPSRRFLPIWAFVVFGFAGRRALSMLPLDRWPGGALFFRRIMIIFV